VDVFTGRLFEAAYDGDTLHNVTSLNVGGVLTACAPLADRSGWIVAANQGISRLSREGEVTTLTDPEANRGGSIRMNDGACDSAGRFWVGSMAFDATPGVGSLYRYDDSGGTCTRVLSGLTISNGIGWSPDSSRLYHVDSGPATLTEYPYDTASGHIGAPHLLVQLSGGGEPDGLCVDSDGFIWLAVWGVGQVRRYSPKGELVCVVDVPANQPTSCALGGIDERQLFITSARHRQTDAQLAQQPETGKLFAVEVETAGLPIQPFGRPT
jgi:sugar lactone lactonase YvrE